MSNDSDFFGDVFDDPEDDPLLGGGDAPSDVPSEGPDGEGPPSWMTEDARGRGGHAGGDPDTARPDQKRIRVDPAEDAGDGLDSLNRAVGQGWRLVGLSLARPGDEPGGASEPAYHFVATLEQDRPQSLFDFGMDA